MACLLAIIKKGSEYLLTEIRVRKGESLDKALRRLKKRLDRENVIKDARNNRYSVSYTHLTLPTKRIV